MISSITKPKLPNAYSYVLKTSILEETLRNNNITTDATLTYWKPQIISSIFEVHFWLPSENIDYNRLYIRSGALLKKDVQSAREGLINEIIPEFVKWVKAIEQLEKATTLYPKLYFNGCYQNNKVVIVK